MIFSFILLYLLQLNSYTLLLDLLRFSPAWLSSQRVSSIKPALVGHSLFPLLSSCACFHIMGRECFVSSAPNDLCRLIKPSLSWDQGCLMSDHSMGRAPMATFIHRAFHSKGRSKHLVATVLMDTTLLCPGHLTHSHESSLNKQVFIFENAKRMLGCFFPPTIKRGFSSRNHKNFLSNSLYPTSILLHSSWHGEGTKVGDGKISACKISSLLLLTQKFEKNNKKQQTA